MPKIYNKRDSAKPEINAHKAMEISFIDKYAK